MLFSNSVFNKWYFVVSVVFLILASFAINYYFQSHIDFKSETIGIDFIHENTTLFVFGSFIIGLILLICGCIFNNIFLGTSIFFTCTVLLVFGDTAKFSARGEHVMPADIITSVNFNTMTGMYDADQLHPTLMKCAAIIFIGIALTIAVHLIRKKMTQDNKADNMSKIRLLSIGTRFLIIVISIIGIIASTAQIRNPTVSSIYNLHYDFIPWSQTENVLQNGYVVAFISNFRGSGSEKPDMYSEDKIKDIVQKYGAVAKTENENRYNLSDDDIDIIYILNESFCDPDEFAEYYSYSGGNLLPNLHEIQKKSATGHLFSPAYGGGTANVEFEALTGFSNYFLIGSLPFQDILPKVSTFPSVASMLKSGCEYQAWGLHPFTTEFYRRSIDYPIMGFDAIYGAADMNNTAHDRTAGYISDKSAYAEVFEMLNGGNDKNFITLITMQNHSSYGGQYAEHQFHITSDIPDAEKLAIDDYMELLHSSDAALGNLIESVDKREKKTVVVFWGDHLPGIYSKLNEADKALLYQVPFLIHSNFAQKDFDLGVVSPNYISTALFDYLEVEKPPFYYLLDDVKGETPVLTNNYYEKHSPLETDALIAYRMIEYDTVSGKGYAKKLGFFDILETQANQATQSTSGIAK